MHQPWVRRRLGHADLSITSLYVNAVDDGSTSADIIDDLGIAWE